MFKRIKRGLDFVEENSLTKEIYFTILVMLVLIFIVGILFLMFVFIKFDITLMEIRGLAISLLPLPIYLYWLGSDKKDN